MYEYVCVYVMYAMYVKVLKKFLSSFNFLQMFSVNFKSCRNQYNLRKAKKSEKNFKTLNLPIKIV